MAPREGPAGRRRAWRLLAASLAFAAIATACGEDTGRTGSLRVVATTSILGDVTQNVIGDRATVEVLIPIGADPHGYQPSAQQVAAIQSADLVIANGLLLEEGLEDVLDNAESDGGNVLRVAEKLDPIPFSGSGDHETEADDDRGDYDPHVWLDPLRMADAARLIARELAALEPGVDWQAAAEEYAARLFRVHGQIEEILAPVPLSHRKLITNHHSLGYFARRYGFEVVGVVIPGGSTLGDPSSAALAELVEVIRSHGVGAVFSETTEPAALAEAVAAETELDVAVVPLYTGSLGEPGSGADTLIGMLHTDAERIASALAP